MSSSLKKQKQQQGFEAGALRQGHRRPGKGPSCRDPAGTGKCGGVPVGSGRRLRGSMVDGDEQRATGFLHSTEERAMRGVGEARWGEGRRGKLGTGLVGATLARVNDEDSGAEQWLAGAPLLSMELGNEGTGRQQPRAEEEEEGAPVASLAAAAGSRWSSSEVRRGGLVVLRSRRRGSRESGE